LEKIQKLEEQEKSRQAAAEAEKKAVEAAQPSQKIEAKAEAKKEERKPEAAKKPEKEEKKREVVLERNYSVPLASAYKKAQTKRGNYAVRLTKDFVARHLKVDASKVRLDSSVSNAVFARGSTRPPKKLRVNASK